MYEFQFHLVKMVTIINPFNHFLTISTERNVETIIHTLFLEKILYRLSLYVQWISSTFSKRRLLQIIADSMILRNIVLLNPAYNNNWYVSNMKVEFF